MKLIVAVFSLVFFSHSGDTLLVVDKELKKPLGRTSDFTTQLYLQRNFPVYAAESEAVVDAIDQAVKWISREPSCDATTRIKAGHTTIAIELKCEDGRKIDLSMVTAVDESQTSFSFSMARNEYDLRKVQRKLLDFATYLNQ